MRSAASSDCGCHCRMGPRLWSTTAAISALWLGK
ncbi:Uncharacterised protein [Bordetella pertussis]|nr:Uncharacterised protein [Bordetella pertussis]